MKWIIAVLMMLLLIFSVAAANEIDTQKAAKQAQPVPLIYGEDGIPAVDYEKLMLAYTERISSDMKTESSALQASVQDGVNVALMQQKQQIDSSLLNQRIAIFFVVFGAALCFFATWWGIYYLIIVRTSADYDIENLRTFLKIKDEQTRRKVFDGVKMYVDEMNHAIEARDATITQLRKRPYFTIFGKRGESQ